jgi:3-oxoadipate enol-lactonase
VPFIDVNGVSIHYEDDGRGPPVVLLHEIGGSLESWDGVAPALAERFRVLRFDQRGGGRSEKVRAQFGIAVLVDDLEALVSALALAPPYSFVGVAGAATLMLMFLQRHPEQVAKLVFCNPAPGVDASRADQLEERAGFAEREGMRAALPLTLDKSYPAGLGEPLAYATYRGRYLGNDPLCFGYANRALARTNMTDMLAKVHCPTLVLAGRHDAVRAPAVTESIAQKIPGARFELIEDSGHFMPTQAPGSLLKHLQEFLG